MSLNNNNLVTEIIIFWLRNIRSITIYYIILVAPVIIHIVIDIM